MLFCLLPLVGNSLFAEITQTESHPPANHEKKKKAEFTDWHHWPWCWWKSKPLTSKVMSKPPFWRCAYNQRSPSLQVKVCSCWWSSLSFRYGTFHAVFVYNAKGDFKKMSMTAPHTSGNRFPCFLRGLGPGRGRRAHFFLQFRLAKKKKSDTQSFKQKAHPLHYECRGGQGQPYIATRWCSAPPELFFSFYLSLARACCFPVHAVTRRRRWSLCMFKAVPVCASLELYFVTWLSACGWTRRQLQTEKSKWVSHRDTCTWKRKETFAGTDWVHKTSAAWSCSKNCKERRKAVPVLRGLPGSFGCVQPSGCHTEDARLTKPEAPPWGRRGAWKWK